MKNKLELRMYGLVPYNISPIQQGIQYGHAVVEYAQKHFKDIDYQDWAKNYKTFIILNGGTTNQGDKKTKPYPEYYVPTGSIQKHELLLRKNKIKHECFFEPDLNDTMTGIVFLVDERVFNREKYPDFVSNPTDTLKLAKINYDSWIKSIGGKKNEFLRGFLKNFRLA